jgi:hypothetical protein
MTAFHSGRGVRPADQPESEPQKGSEKGKRRAVWLAGPIWAFLQRYSRPMGLPAFRSFFPDTPVARGTAVVCVAALGAAALAQAVRAVRRRPSAQGQ